MSGGVNNSGSSERRALLIGISKYQEVKKDQVTNAPAAAWPFLKGPANDVNNFAGLFRDLGFKEQNITILNDSKATKIAIITELKKITSIKGNEYDVTVIMFCGYGYCIEKGEKKTTEILAPYDSYQNSPECDTITEDEIKEIMSNAKAHNITLILDTCFQEKSAHVGRVMTSGARGRILTDNLNYVLLDACNTENAYSVEVPSTGQMHCVFSYALYDKLRSYMVEKESNETRDASTGTNSAAAAAGTQQFTHYVNTLRLSKLCWLELFPHVTERMRKLNRRSMNKTPPQLHGLRAWKVFGFEMKRVHHYFPGIIDTSSPDWNKLVLNPPDEEVTLKVLLHAGYLHGIERSMQWELEFIEPPGNGQLVSENIFKLSYTGLIVEKIAACETLLTVTIERPTEAESDHLLSLTKMPLKAIELFKNIIHLSKQVVTSEHKPLEKEDVESVDSKDENQDFASFKRYEEYAKELLELRHLSDRYRIEYNSYNSVYELKSAQNNRILFSSNTLTNDCFNIKSFIKKVDCFVRWIHLLEMPWRVGPENLDWIHSQNTMVDDLIIVIQLKSRTLASNASGEVAEEQQSEIELSNPEKRFTKEDPLVVREGERYMITARNVPNTTAQSKRDDSIRSLSLALLEFDTNCAISLLHPLPGTRAKLLEPNGKSIQIHVPNEKLEGSGILVPKSAIPEANGDYTKTLRFVVSTFPIDFQFLVQSGIDDPSQSEWEFAPDRKSEITRGSEETRFFKVIDVVLKINK